MDYLRFDDNSIGHGLFEVGKGLNSSAERRLEYKPCRGEAQLATNWQAKG